MSSTKLDKSLDYATVTGDTEGRVFEQNEKFFRADGSLWRDPKVKETAAEKAEREKAEKEESDRLAAEAAKKPEGADDQLSKQLSTGSGLG